jgi:hypothetical protein
MISFLWMIINCWLKEKYKNVIENNNFCLNWKETNERWYQFNEFITIFQN